MTWRVVVLVAACGGAAEVPSAPSNRAESGVVAPPDLATLRALLVPHGRETFSREAQTDRGCNVEDTLARYLATLAQNGTLTGGCGAFPASPAMIDPPQDAAYWYCRVDSFSADPDIWHYELRVRVRKADRAVDLATVACPGTP